MNTHSQSKRYQEALDEFYDIAEEEGADIIVISMKLFLKLGKGEVTGVVLK